MVRNRGLLGLLQGHGSFICNILPCLKSNATPPSEAFELHKHDRTCSVTFPPAIITELHPINATHGGGGRDAQNAKTKTYLDFSFYALCKEYDLCRS